jgi:flagellin-specific chaperone FliS
MEDGSVGMQKLLRDYQVFQRRLEEAKYNRDVDSQRHFEKILKSIKEQLHHNHLSHSTKPPTPPSNEIKPIVRSAQSTG